MGRSETDVEHATFERFRGAVREAIARSTLRTVAKDVGMSPSGLQKFLNGTNPYGKTRERLHVWYFREAGFSSFGVEDAAYILRRMGRSPRRTMGWRGCWTRLKARTGARGCTRPSGCGWCGTSWGGLTRNAPTERGAGGGAVESEGVFTRRDRVHFL
jgi:hypothetical protein